MHMSLKLLTFLHQVYSKIGSFLKQTFSPVKHAYPCIFPSPSLEAPLAAVSVFKSFFMPTNFTMLELQLSISQLLPSPTIHLVVHQAGHLDNRALTCWPIESF